MKHVIKISKLTRFSVMALCSTLLACQPLQTAVLQPEQQANTSAFAPVRYQPKAVPYARVTTVGAPAANTQKLSVKLTYPQSSNDFRTQAFGCGEVAYAKVWVNGSSLSAPLYADGSDSDTHFIATSGCELSATLSNVPYGNLVVSIQLFDSEERLLTGSELKGALRLSTTSQNLELSYRQLPAGRLLEALLNGPIADRFLAGQLDLAALQSLIDSLMVVSNSFPNYSYDHHPSLINFSLLLSDLKAQNGNIAALLPDSRYIYTAGSVRLNLNGYLINQDVSLSIDDALSPNAIATANGQVILSNVPPGTWQLRLSGPGYLSRQVSVTVQANQQTNLGTVSIYPPQATLTGISPASGTWGTQVTLTGTNFNPTQANNIVRFGSTQATVISANLTELIVTAPDNLAVGSYPISVTIGAANAATGQSFSVVNPSISSLSGSTGSTDDQITIIGTGFSDTDAQNTVSFGSTQGTIVSATPTQIVVAVPERAAGVANISVDVNGQSSSASGFTILPRISSLSTGQTLSGKVALIRGQTLNITGTNFSPTAANNVIHLGSINLVASSATATQLTVIIPSTLTTPGDLRVSVVSNSQTSNSITAVVPSINIDFSGGFN